LVYAESACRFSSRNGLRTSSSSNSLVGIIQWKILKGLSPTAPVPLNPSADRTMDCKIYQLLLPYSWTQSNLGDYYTFSPSAPTTSSAV
jgi:hypothetical protein